MKHQTRQGFTLVEIMIVVVIIGLLAGMAIPAFQKVRENSARSRMDNDARQLAAAAQQYYLEQSAHEVDFTYNGTTGALTSDESDIEEGRDNGIGGYLRMISSGYSINGQTGDSQGINLQRDQEFTIDHPLVDNARVYNPEGQFRRIEE